MGEKAGVRHHPMVGTDRLAFEVYVERVLAPSLTPGQIVEAGTVLVAWTSLDDDATVHVLLVQGTPPG